MLHEHDCCLCQKKLDMSGDYARFIQLYYCIECWTEIRKKFPSPELIHPSEEHRCKKILPTNHVLG